MGKPHINPPQSTHIKPYRDKCPIIMLRPKSHLLTKLNEITVQNI